MEIVAHRGASFEAPENTQAAVKLAWEKNADAVEIDIHLSKDNKIVVIHDYSTYRTSGTALEVKDTDSSRLRKLDVGTIKDKRFEGEQIPFLDEILNLLPPAKKLFLEIKCGSAVLPYLQETITQNHKESQIILMSFDLETIAIAKNVMPYIAAYWLKQTKVNEHTRQMIPHDIHWIDIAMENKLEGMAVRWDGVTTEFVSFAKAKRLNIYVWTVDDPKVASELQKLGIDGIITNRPGWLRKMLNNDVF
ncbi:MAG: hypothetical protein JW709_10235 [Sedimentisphaerales bacterium]|nr:hypothetical protein [Sedimentisphaerales bacterium]